MRRKLQRQKLPQTDIKEYKYVKLPLVRAGAALLLAVSMILCMDARTTAEDSQRGCRLEPAWDIYSDTWVATDALGRQVATFEKTGEPRPDRWVGIFYFLWHGAHVKGGPWDITRITSMDTKAMEEADNPLWGPIHAPHHWGESIFGHYLGDDKWVLRKHAQMLAAAGVDTLIFDTSNKVIYQKNYTALFDTLTEMRAEGNATPYVAFLTPFWDPTSTVKELYEKLYSKGLYSDLWFRWKGKPLILADPDLLAVGDGSLQYNTPARLAPGHTLGQSFNVDSPFIAVTGIFPTWTETGSAMTLTLRRNGPKGEELASRRFESVTDNARLSIRLKEPLPKGAYYLEMSEAKGTIGWWGHSEGTLLAGRAYAEGSPVAGRRTLLVSIVDENMKKIRDFFTFRAPQPSYFYGPTKKNMWSWLEVYPQHRFHNDRGEKEQMSVGVAQNAVLDPNAPPIGGFTGIRTGCLSEKRSLGRSFHKGRDTDDPEATLHGYNFTEQWEHALNEDPLFIFVTGWNEWFGGRFNEFMGVREPVMFVDTFDQEHSRDVEPMKGGHGDNYYYQMVDYIRRFKGTRPVPRASAPKRIDIAGPMNQWQDVGPEYRDAIGDTSHRDHPTYNTVTHARNTTGRNDIVLSKVARDSGSLYFYVKTREAMTPFTDPDWMVLFINTDRDPATGWEGYNIAINRRMQDSKYSVVEHTANGWNWQPKGTARFAVRDNQLMLSVSRDLLDFTQGDAIDIEFKWADNFQTEDDINAFTINGDSAPMGRFNYRFHAD